MTDASQAKPARKRAKAKAAKKSEPTQYIVIEILPANSGERGVKHMNGDDVEGDFVYLPVDTITASGNEKTLIEKWAAEKKCTGAFKLVSARAWKGGARIFEKTQIASEAIS